MIHAIDPRLVPTEVVTRLETELSRAELAHKRIAVYSAGMATRTLLECGALAVLRIEVILDRDPRLQGQALYGIPVRHPDRLEADRPEVIFILSPRFHDSIYLDLQPRCEALGIEVVDLCGPHPTYRRFPSLTPAAFPADALIVSDFLPPDGRRIFRDPDQLRVAHPDATVTLVCCESDEALSRMARALIDAGIRFVGHPKCYGTTWDASPTFEAPQGRCPHVMFKDDRIREAILRSRLHCARHDICSHFDVRDFGNLLQFIRETRDLDGDYVEIGVFRGTSAAVAATYLTLTSDPRRMWLLDTYGGFAYPTATSSMDAVWHGTHEDTSAEFVSRVVAAAGRTPTVSKVDICADPLPDEIGAISVANIDVDMFEAVRDALLKVAPRVVPGGVIVCEDYGHTPELAGADLAVREFVEAHGRDFMKLYFESGQMALVKRR